MASLLLFIPNRVTEKTAMDNQHYSILTTAGAEYFAHAVATGTPVVGAEFMLAVGDSGGQQYEPNESQVNLVAEKWRGKINDIYTNENDASQVIVEGIVPTSVGGWFIREWGVYNSEGILIAVGSMDDTYKSVTSSGIGKQIFIQAILNIDNAAVLELIVDENIVTASKEFVYSEINKVRGDLNLPDGLKLIGHVNGVNQLKTISVQDGDRVQLFDVYGWVPGGRTPTGTGFLRYDALKPKSSHDGFINFSPTVPFNDLATYLSGTGETDSSGYGVFVRENYGTEVLLSHCGIYPLSNSATDLVTATTACSKLLSMTAKGFNVCFDVDLFVADISLSNVNYSATVKFTNKLKLGKPGRILKISNSTASGNISLISPFFDANGFSSIEDGGLLQANNILNIEIRNPVIEGFRTVLFQANGIATTGIGCQTTIIGGNLTNCDSQLLYVQTSKSTMINTFMHDSPGHGVAFVNCDDCYILGGGVTRCNYGLLTYSTTSYRSKMRRLHIQGFSLKGNYKAFEISRRYEESTVSGGNADVVLSDMDITDCTVASTIGNLATDNIDGYAIREVFITNLFSDTYIDCNSVFGVHIKGGRVNSIRIRGKVENVDIQPGKMIGNRTNADTNTAVYLYASASVKNITLDAFSYFGINSYAHAETGAVVNGPFIIRNPVVDPSGMSYKVNSNLYGFVACNSGNRKRDMSHQSWGEGLSFWDESLKKVVVWNGTNITDTIGNLIS
jgi:hypothetical protein